jgi:hypothetical protein
MLDFMNGHYEKMRNENHLNDYQTQEEEEPKLEMVLKTLRPNTTAKNFKPYLTRGQNTNKSQNWRVISRKVHQTEAVEKINENKTAKMLQNTAQSFF